MKKHLLLGLVFYTSLMNAWQILDSIKVVIFTPEGTEIITATECGRSALTGMTKSVEEIVFERLVYLDAKRFKAIPDEDAIDKYIARVLRENNMKLDDLKKMFEKSGRTFQEGREELRKMQAVSSMISNKIHSGLMVSRQDVLNYYNEHPQYADEQIYVVRVVIPFSAQDKGAQKKSLQQQLKFDSFVEKLAWSKPFWLSASEVASSKRYIFELAVDQISEPREVKDGFELFRVIEKKPKQLLMLDERYQEISEALMRPKYTELLEAYKKSLFDEASIVYY